MVKKEQRKQVGRRAFLKLGAASAAAGALWSAAGAPVWAEELTSDRGTQMFVRLIDAPIKPGKRNELMTVLTNELQPMLKKQPGFVDFVWLTGDTNGAEFITVTFWATKPQAEKFYNSHEYTAITDRTKAMHEYMKVRTFNVEASTFHKVVAMTA